QRHEHLDTLVEIARHPVGAANVDLLVAAVGEVVDAAVLQKSSHDASDTNVIAHSAHARAKGTYATDDQINLHSRLRGTIQSLHDVLVEQRVHFGYDAGLASLAGMVGFAINQRNAFLGEIEGSH